jgi:diphthine-ammonia ligase
MKVVVHWSGGKECCSAYHKAIEQGHEVAYLLTYVYMEPYIFHSFLIMELQSKSLGTPHLKVMIRERPRDRRQDMLETLARLNKEEGIEGIVTGDIDNVHHKRAWDDACKKSGMKLIMPLWDRPFSLFPGNRYRERVLNMELSTGIRAIINCIDLKYFSEKWLGREFDRACVQEMKPLVGTWGIGIDAAGEPGEYHTTVLDAPLFKETIEITKFSKKSRVVDYGGSPNRTGNFLYMDIEEAVLRPKNR